MKLDRMKLVGGDVDLLSIPVRSQAPSENEIGVFSGRLGVANSDASWEDVPTPYTTGPGPTQLVAGTEEAGYFGLVDQNDLVSYDDIAAEFNVLGSFVSGYEAGNWLKFLYEGRTLFVAQRGIKTGLSWEHLYQLGIVYGTDDTGRFPYGPPKVQDGRIELDGVTYKVRLLTGASSDPSSAEDRTDTRHPSLSDSEWTKLIVRVSDGTWASFSDNALGFINNGQTWCQESQGNNRLLHGVTSAYDTYFRTASDNSGYRGWRPVLELVQ